MLEVRPLLHLLQEVAQSGALQIFLRIQKTREMGHGGGVKAGGGGAWRAADTQQSNDSTSVNPPIPSKPQRMDCV